MSKAFLLNATNISFLFGLSPSLKVNSTKKNVFWSELWRIRHYLKNGSSVCLTDSLSFKPNRASEGRMLTETQAREWVSDLTLNGYGLSFFRAGATVRCAERRLTYERGERRLTGGGGGGGGRQRRGAPPHRHSTAGAGAALGPGRLRARPPVRTPVAHGPSGLPRGPPPVRTPVAAVLGMPPRVFVRVHPKPPCTAPPRCRGWEEPQVAKVPCNSRPRGIPLQGSVDAPDVTRAWGFHPGSRDLNWSRGHPTWRGVVRPLAARAQLARSPPTQGQRSASVASLFSLFRISPKNHVEIMDR